MRLLKSAEMVLGLALGGGMLLGLSGGAFAAEGSVNTTSQTVTQENSGQPSAPAETKDASTVTVSVLTVAKSTQGSETVAPTPTKLGDVAANTSDQSVGAQTVKSDATNVSTATPGTTGEAVKANSADATKSLTGTETAATLAAAGVAENPATIPAEPALTATRNTVSTEPVYHNVVLPVQPMITNTRPAVINDLAATLPSAPTQQDPANVPTPSQPSGLFGALIAQLAGVVVPHVFLAPVLGFAGLTVAYTLLILASAFAARRFVTSFGLWLRCGGYAHAARSDVAVATFTSLFATPFSLSFVTAHSPARSSFFMVSETKTILFVSPTLLERRK